MKLIDKKGKLFGKFNIIDIFVVLVVLVLAAGTYFKFGVMDKTSTAAAMEDVTYTVEIKCVRDYAFENVIKGDTLYDKASGNAIGEIVDIEFRPAMDVVEMLDGSAVMGEIENRYDVTLTVEAQAVVNDSGHFVNRTYELLVGSNKEFITKYFECEGQVGKIY